MSNFGDHPTGFFGDSSFYNGVATQSARFDLSNSAYLTRTPDSAGNQALWTASMWIKRTGLTNDYFFGTQDGGSSIGSFSFATTGKLIVNNKTGGTGCVLNTDMAFRDTSAWYHLVVVYKGDEAAAANRTKIYVNGSQVATTVTEAGGTGNGFFNAATATGVGRVGSYTSNFLDGYLADVNLVDGLGLDPSYFGQTKGGVWIAKEPVVSDYGTNGFRLQFAQVGVGTASTTTIGADTSGETNHFTSSGIVASDCNMPDSPENNFSTFNPNFRAVTANTLSEGNLFCATSSGGRSFSATTIPIKLGTGKWFWEFRVSADGGGMGVAKTNGVAGAGAYQSVTATGTGANTTDYYYGETNFVVYADQIIHNGGNAVALDGSPTYPEVYGILFDSDASPPNMAVYRGGTAVGNINCDNGFDYLPMGGDGSGAVTINVIFNAGQDSTFAGNETAATNTDVNGFGNF